MIVNFASNNLVVCTTASASGLSSPGVSCISSDGGHQASGGCDNTAVADTSHVFKVYLIIFPMDDV